jgi:hypothetical protein
MKYVFTIAIPELHRVGARLIPAGDRAACGVDVVLPRNMASLTLECTQEDSYVVYSTFDEHHVNVARTWLDSMGLVGRYSVEDVEGQLISVRVVDLLDTHWMLFQMIDEPKLRITSTDGSEHYLSFFNSDTNGSLVAEFDSSGPNAGDGHALTIALNAMGTTYKVTG